MSYQKMIVSLDIGTSGCRAAAVRADGSVAARHECALVPLRSAPGLSEYKAEDLLHAARQTLHTVLDAVGPQQVSALAVASQRSTVVVWDKTTGKPVGPVLTWEDGRAQAQATRAEISQEELHAVTGLYKTPFFSAPKIAWVLQNVPQAAQLVKEGKLLAAPVASYLIWHLTDGKTFAVDESLAQRTLLVDIAGGTWSEKLCRAFGIPPEILPALLPSAADYGVHRYQGIDIPIRVCVGDQQAAAAYFCLDRQDSLINYGTGAFWLYHAGRNPVFLPGMLTSVAATHNAAEKTYFLEGPVNCAGSVLLWLQAQGLSFEEADIQTLCVSAKSPVWFLPALGGLGAPYWDFTVSAAARGLSPLTRKEDWVAGAVRGIAFLLADIAAYLRVNGCATEGKIQVSGGLSKLDYLTAFQADLLQQDLWVTEQADATLLGAASLAAAQQGCPLVFTKTAKQVSPVLSPQAARALYTQWQQFVTAVRH